MPAAELDSDAIALLLLEAESFFDARQDQALRAESRATTLQASAGIAIGLALTGAAFLVDPSKVADRPWRLALAAVFAALLFCLGMAGYLANRATAKLLPYSRPDRRGIVERTNLGDDEARRSRAVSLLDSASENLYFSTFKIKQVKVAGLWFRVALACFAVLSILLTLYVAFGPIPHVAK